MALLASLVACKGESTPRAPAEVRDAVARQLTSVGIDARQLDQASGLFKPVDLTPQAAPDWVVDFSALPSAPLCGTGGCLLQVWVKTEQAPYALAFERQVLGHEVARHEDGRGKLSVQLHGVLCGGTGSDDCRYHFEWLGDADARGGYFAAASIGGKPTRYEGPLVQALPVLSPAGSGVAQLLDRVRARCAAVGATANLDQALVRIPDLNGDGRPELLFDASQADCERDNEAVTMDCTGPTCRNHLFTEHGGQGWKAAWSGEPFAYAIDLGQRGPRLLIRAPSCEKQCPEKSLVWQDGTRRFAALAP